MRNISMTAWKAVKICSSNRSNDKFCLYFLILQNYFLIEITVCFFKNGRPKFFYKTLTLLVYYRRIWGLLYQFFWTTCLHKGFGWMSGWIDGSIGKWMNRWIDYAEVILKFLDILVFPRCWRREPTTCWFLAAWIA